jgi:diadenylate cyclase
MGIVGELWSKYLLHILDILIMAYIFYNLILLLKGTRAIEISLGILVLLLFTFLVRDVLKLPTLSILLQLFWNFIVIILVVVFQPEIRAAFARLGRARLVYPIFKEKKEVINELIKGVKELLSRKVGAIVVLEGQTGLREYIESGVKINGELSSDLLTTIFYPKGPLHDGAVIVSGGRLIGARCILPISQNSEIAGVLGMRHRAGLGLSEVSDAFVIIVSEETQQISVAENGVLHQNVSLGNLEERIESWYKRLEENILIQFGK